MTLSELRREFEASFRDTPRDELEENIMFSSVSDDFIRGTSNPTAVTSGDYLRILGRTGSSRTGDNDLSTPIPFEDFSGNVIPLMGPPHEKVRELDSISPQQQSYLSNDNGNTFLLSHQATVCAPITLSGVGLHSGRPSTVTLHPASAGYGIWFRRTDVGSVDALVPARWESVDPTPLCARIVNESGVSVSSIENLMAALYGCGIANVLVEIDGPEVPILDGSAAEFVSGILQTGVKTLSEPRSIIEVLKPVEVVQDGVFCRLEPFYGFEMRFEINFSDAAIGFQQKALNLARQAFIRELCDSRKYCRLADLDKMHEAGFGLGGNFRNAVVVDGAKVLSPGGFRYADEAVRNKMSSAVGDLALAGAQIAGRFVAYASGHLLTNQLLRKLFADPGAYRITEDRELGHHLPGVGKPDDHPQLKLLA